MCDVRCSKSDTNARPDGQRCVHAPLGSSPIVHRRASASGFTIAELLVVTGLIILLIAVGAPAIRAMFSGSTLDSGKTVISASVAAARAFATRELVLDGGDYKGAAVLFRNGEISVIRNTKIANGGPIFTTMGSVDIVKLDPSLGVVAVSRGGSSLYLTPMTGTVASNAFAIRFDRNGMIIARRSGTDDLVDFDGNGDGDANDSTDTANIRTMLGVIVFSKADLIADVGGDLTTERSGGSEYDWILENGEAVFFSRYSGVALSQ